MNRLALKAVQEINTRFRPREGWVAVILLCLAVGSVAAAVLAVGWVAEDGVVLVAVVVGTFLGLVLAKRQLSSIFAWGLILLYILFAITIYLAKLLPPYPILGAGDEAVRQYWLQSGGFFIDRMGSWLLAVSRGGRSQETIVFAFGLGLLAGILAAYTAWMTFRVRKPFVGLALLGFLLAANSYYGDLGIAWMGGFVGIVALVTAVLHFTNLEEKWQRTAVDYSDQLRLDLMLYAGAIAILLVGVSILLPSFSISKIGDAFWQLTAVSQTDATIERVFAGVEPARRPARTPSRGRIGGEGIMPRDYLLGLAPELGETVMMTATVAVQNGDGTWQPASASLLKGRRWRSLSYQDYTGKGWVLTEERRADVPAFTPIKQEAVADVMTLKQQVFWQRDKRITRYTIGLPQQFDQDTIAVWRGIDDLVRVWGEGTIYEAESQLSLASPTLLRETAVSDIPAAIKARYTPLPDTVPQRVHDLAQEIAGDLDNPYDQARAIEQFLRQYPYSLDVPLPPSDADPVDYFLFDLQIGYCDYYASAMVVMARSLGLPARMAVGFLGQSPDENGVQTILQLNGHSWAEVYFAEYGWVEFEPTAAFASPRDTTINGVVVAASSTANNEERDEEDFSYPAIPDRAPLEKKLGQRLLFVAILFLFVVVIWWRQRSPKIYANKIEWAYDHWQQRVLALEQRKLTGQTVDEFRQQSWQQLEMLTDRAQAEEMQTHVQQLTDVYNNYQYSPEKVVDGEETAVSAWQSLKRPLSWLQFKYKFRRPKQE